MVKYGCFNRRTFGHKSRFRIGINEFNVGEELPLFFLSLLDKTDYLIHNDSRNVSGIRTLLVVLDQTISLLRLILEEANEDDQQQWELLAGCFETISQNLQRHTLEMSSWTNHWTGFSNGLSPFPWNSCAKETTPCKYNKN